MRLSTCKECRRHEGMDGSFVKCIRTDCVVAIPAMPNFYYNGSRHGEKSIPNGVPVVKCLS